MAQLPAPDGQVTQAEVCASILCAAAAAEHKMYGLLLLSQSAATADEVPAYLAKAKCHYESLKGELQLLTEELNQALDTGEPETATPLFKQAQVLHWQKSLSKLKPTLDKAAHKFAEQVVEMKLMEKKRKEQEISPQPDCSPIIRLQ